MRAVGRTSKTWVWGTVAALTIGMVGIGGPATAAPPAKSSAPAATASAAEPVDDGVPITYTFNRAAKPGNPTVTCTLDGDPITCGTPTTTAKKLTTYTLNLTDLTGGAHTFAVTFRLTAGDTAKASADFTIDAVPRTLQEACTDLTGTLTVFNAPGSVYAWHCAADPYTGTQPGSPADNTAWDLAVRDTFAPFCTSGLLDSGYDVTTGGDLIAAAYVRCKA